MSEAATNDLRDVEQLANEFMLAYRAGKRPSIEEFARQYPSLADELRDLLRALVLLEQNAPHDSTTFNSVRPKVGQQAPDEVGEFLIVREIGRGGMGVVYEAVQQSLGRHVALKILNTSGRLNDSHLERFRLESRAAARLHHSHIVPVFGVGESNGVHYYVMQFIQGQSLDVVIGALRQLRNPARTSSTTPMGADLQTIAFSVLRDGQGAINEDREARPHDAKVEAVEMVADVAPSDATSSTELSAGQNERDYFRSVARVGLQIAEALAYAHGEGILHRDVKPSNLLLDAKANVWITDFGLAKAEDSDGVTKTGDFVGTLRYMAPERLAGWSDRRSDIYGLGATLYELLTLRPLFDGQSGGQLLESILHESPVRPGRLDSSIPTDLETIVLTAIAKEPAARYHTAEAMAEDLQRFLDDRPILARRSTQAERLVRWCRRNPLVAGLVGTVAALLLAAVTILAISNAQIRRESAARAVALNERSEALAKAREAVDRLLFRVSEEKLSSVPLADPVRRGLLQDALGFYESFIVLDEQNESLRFQLAEVLRRSAAVEYYFSPEKARELSARGVQIFDGLVHDSPSNYDYRLSLTRALETQCYLWTQSKTADGYRQAKAIGERCLEIHRELQAERPADLQHTCKVLFRLAVVAEANGDVWAAKQYCGQAIENARGILTRTPTDGDALSTIYDTCLALARFATPEERERLLKEALQSADALDRIPPRSAHSQYAIARAKFDLATHYRGILRQEESIALFRECWQGMASVCTDRPNSSSAWQWARGGFDNGLEVLRRLGRDEDAIRWANEYWQWLKHFESRLTADPIVQKEYYASEKFVADQLRSFGKAEQADELKLATDKRLAGLPSSALVGEQFGDLLMRRATELSGQGNWPEAAAECARVIDSASDDWFTMSPRKSRCRQIAEMPEVFPLVAELRPKESALWIGRAQYLVWRGRWDEAKADYSKVIYSRRPQEEHIEYAALLLLRGALDEYQTFCSKIVEGNGPPKDAYNAYVMARVCAFGPAKCVDSQELVNWAKRTIEDPLPWHQHTLGLAFLRANQPEAAIERFEESIRIYPPGILNAGKNYFALAIAHEKLGQQKQAADSLARGRETLQLAGPAQPGEQARIGPPGEWIAINLLANEAEAKVQRSENQPSADAKRSVE